MSQQDSTGGKPSLLDAAVTINGSITSDAIIRAYTEASRAHLLHPLYFEKRKANGLSWILIKSNPGAQVVKSVDDQAAAYRQGSCFWPYDSVDCPPKDKTGFHKFFETE